MKNKLHPFALLLLVGATLLSACGPFAAGPVEKTIYVGPYEVDCVGVAPQKCLLVKEKPEEDWTFFYDQIQGFEYEPGFEYELRITEEEVENPPADASSIRWTLVEVVDKTRSLEGTIWLLDSYLDSEGNMVAVLPGSQVTALFQADQVGGNASCNSYFGAYETDGAKLMVETGGMTMMMCQPPELADQENAYIAALNSAARYLVTEDELRIADADGRTVLKYGILTPTPLVGTQWEVTRYNNGKGGLASTTGNTQITALFAEDGSVTGTASCNNYSAPYEVAGNPDAPSGSISIGLAATTRMMCHDPQGIMEQESAYLAALQSATRYEITGDQLELFDARGTRAMTYVAKAEGTGLDEETLANMEYKSEWTQSGTAPLTDGEYREQAAPGSATETIVKMTEWVAYGELDGQPAAAVVLVTDPGGSGTFYDLALVVEQDGQPVNVATAHLGDRVQINSLAIENDEIVVDMIAHGPDDPMCCPTQQVVQTYALQGDQLVETSSQVADAGPGGEQSLTGVVWQWIQFTDPKEQINIDDPGQYAVEFLPDGKVNAKADCNSGNGTYSTEGSQINIEIMAMTRAMCPPDSLSDQFVAYLNEAVLYSFAGENLILDLPVDSGTMMFAPSGQ